MKKQESHNRGVETVADMLRQVEVTIKRTAEDLGHDAYQRGLSYDPHCPFKEGSISAEMWHIGWLDAWMEKHSIRTGHRIGGIEI